MTIGIFDSGMGGLAVLKACIRAYPEHSFVFYADHAHFPFGNKSKEALSLIMQDALDFFSEQSISLLIIACHTLSVQYPFTQTKPPPFPVIDMKNAFITAVKNLTQKTTAILIGTNGTIDSGVYKEILNKMHPQWIIHSLALPQLVSHIEIDHPSWEKVASSFIHQNGYLLLLCTHFSMIKEKLKTIWNSQAIIDPIDHLSLPFLSPSAAEPTIKIFSSNLQPLFFEAAKKLLGSLGFQHEKTAEKECIFFSKMIQCIEK